MTTTLSVRIDSDTKDQLEALAKRSRRSKSFLAAEAIPPMWKRRDGSWMRFKLASGSLIRGALSPIRMCRNGSDPGARSVNERRLARDYRLVAAGDRPSR